MKAVIMAGGEGTRLRPLTCTVPKPMVPVANKPMMEHIIELLVRYEFRDIAVTLQYMPEIIREYFSDGSTFNARIRYYVEDKPLGTAGSVKNAESFLDDTFIVISGDALTDINLEEAVAFHKSKNAMATLVLKRVDVPLEYGVVVTDNEGRIIRFLEKPGWSQVFSETVNTGIYILSPEIFKYIRGDKPFDFSRDLFPILLNENKPLYGYETHDYWCDVGDVGAYIKANMDIMNGNVKLNIPAKELGRGIWVGKDTVIDNGVKITAPCIIGSGCRIKEGSELGGFTVIGDNNVISSFCGIKRSIIWKNCTINENVQLRGSVICNNVHLKKDVNAFEQSVVADHSIIGENAVISPNIKIWPDKLIEEGTTVSSNIVWGSKSNRQIFGNRGICGEINTDITPEFAARVGAAFGAISGRGASVGISCDNSNASVMIKNALISGLISAGSNVADFKTLILPSARHAVRFFKLDCGIHVSTCTGKDSRITIDFLAGKGNNIDRSTERKIEIAYMRDDFNRCEGDCLKKVREVNGFTDIYKQNILNSIKIDKLPYKIGVAVPSDFVLEIVKSIFSQLGCEVVQISEKSDKGIHERLDVKEFCKAVVRSRFDLGVSIEESCEKMMLVDEKGRIVTDDMFIALISIVLFKTIKGGTMIVPISASQVVEKIADMYQGKVIRTKASHRDVMGRLLGREASAGLLEQFTMHFDSIAGLMKIMEFIRLNQLKMSDLIDMIPKIHMHKQQVECRWDAKGKVIRKLIQEHSSGRIETLDGVKMYHDKGWVLVLPDGEKPVCSVMSEGINTEFAEELTNIYVRKVREISRG